LKLLKKLDEKMEGVTGFIGYRQQANPDDCIKNHVRGFLVGRGKRNKEEGVERCFVSPLKRSVPEREPDLVELHNRMARNPSFIPHYAWGDD